MKLVRGIWLPSSDTHFERMMSKAPWSFRDDRLIGSYQRNKLNRALDFTKKRRIALDVGAHVGFYSMWLADVFRHVHAFEPVLEHAECFERNVRQPNVTMHRCAVGASCGLVGIETNAANSGKARVSGSGDVSMIRIDDLGFAKVDLVKIDVEGGEDEVIEGAAEAIMRSRPFIIIEQNNEPTAVRTLVSMGMRVREKIGQDYLMQF